MIATEVSDVLFGTSKPRASQANIGVLKEDQVNIILHGHSPLVSEMTVRAAQDPVLFKRAKELGATGINLAGLCCTGNEVLIRQGIPMAGNHLVQELALVTGAVEAIGGAWDWRPVSSFEAWNFIDNASRNSKNY